MYNVQQLIFKHNDPIVKPHVNVLLFIVYVTIDTIYHDKKLTVNFLLTFV